MNVALTVPVHSLLQPATARALTAAADHLRAHGHAVELSFLSQESLISRARDTVAAHFLRSLMDTLISVDSDMVFTPEHMLALLDEDAPVICANYPSKDGAPFLQPGGEGVVPAEEIALGFVRIERQALEDVIAAHDGGARFPLDYYPHMQLPCVWGFHVPFIHADRYLSDAQALSFRLRGAGVQMRVDTTLNVGHVMRTTRYAR